MSNFLSGWLRWNPPEISTDKTDKTPFVSSVSPSTGVFFGKIPPTNNLQIDRVYEFFRDRVIPVPKGLVTNEMTYQAQARKMYTACAAWFFRSDATPPSFERFQSYVQKLFPDCVCLERYGELVWFGFRFYKDGFDEDDYAREVQNYLKRRTDRQH